MESQSDIVVGWSLDPVESAPAILALIVAALVWRRHTADRRARLFFALAASELALGLPLVLIAANMPEGPTGVGAVQALVLTGGLVSATVFLHFGLSFPHARPWLRRGNIKRLYWASLVVGLAVFAAAALGAGQAIMRNTLDATMVGLGLVVLAASVAACVAIYRSYREMTADERRIYRIPVLGVLVGMIAGVAVDVLLGLMFATLFGTENRYMLWTANLLATAAALLLPLFFFMGATKYRLLERHAQDYVVSLEP